jgi:hypothetical protein
LSFGNALNFGFVIIFIEGKNGGKEVEDLRKLEKEVKVLGSWEKTWKFWKRWQSSERRVPKLKDEKEYSISWISCRVFLLNFTFN